MRRKTYRIQHVGFTRFVQFFRAMQTASIETVEHYSRVTFRFEDGVSFEYRLGRLPVAYMTESSSKLSRVATCTERPGVSVWSVPDRIPPLNKEVTYVYTPSKQVTETELAEIWEFSCGPNTYILVRSGTGPDKAAASHAAPAFSISVVSSTRECVYDLFGRFENGTEIALHVTFTPDPVYL